MAFEFEKLEVWKRALEYGDAVDEIASALPKHERFNLTDQIRRAATSIALNIAEGSTGQSDAEQIRFLGYAQLSLVETVACLHLIRRRGYTKLEPLREAYVEAEALFRQRAAFRRFLGATVREEDVTYDLSPPF